MLFKLSLAALAALVSAQTWTECDPLLKTCPANAALAGTYEHDFKSGQAAKDFFLTSTPVTYAGGNAIFRVAKTLDSPTIRSKFHIMFGHLEVKMKAAPGAGIVSSLVLQSDTRDEIDWEWIGADPENVQTNFYTKGIPDYSYGGKHQIGNALEWHTYGLDWTSERINWLIDGKVIRTRTYAENATAFPQTPCSVRIGSWSGGDSNNPKGTIEWAMGPTRYDEGPFDMLVADIKVIDYSSGKEYRYKDRNGNKDSIEAVGGQIMAGAQTGPGNVYKTPTKSVTVSSSTVPTYSKPSGFTKVPTDSQSAPTPSGYGQSSPGSSDKQLVDAKASASSTPSASPSPAVATGAAGSVVLAPALLVGAAMAVLGWTL